MSGSRNFIRKERSAWSMRTRAKLRDGPRPPREAGLAASKLTTTALSGTQNIRAGKIGRGPAVRHSPCQLHRRRRDVRRPGQRRLPSEAAVAVLQLGFVNFPMGPIRRAEARAEGHRPNPADARSGRSRCQGRAAKDDVVACNGKPVRTVEDLARYWDDAAGKKKLMLSVMCKQQLLSAGTPHFGTFH